MSACSVTGSVDGQWVADHFLPAGPRYDFGSRKKCFHFSLEPCIPESCICIFCTILTTPGRLLEEEEHQDNRGRAKTNSPPVLVIPWKVDSDESRKGRSSRSSQIHGDTQDVEGASALVEEEQFNEV